MGFLTIFSDFERIHLGKDVGQVNMISAKYLKTKPYILSYFSGLPSEDGVFYLKIKDYFKRKPGNRIDFNVILFLLLNSKKFNYLNLYHQTFCTQFYTLIYKVLNRNGKVYVKLDLDTEHEKLNIQIKQNLFIKFIKKMVFQLYAKNVDLVSVESNEGYDILSTKKIYSVNKLIKVSNGISTDEIINNFSDVSYDKKRNIFLTVGRIGTRQKCNELLLSVLENLDLKSWSFLFAGPIEKDFIPKIEDFYIKNPHLKDKVLFLGPKDRCEIYDLYKTAKVFTLSSEWEGFPLVYAEASYFGCHIITTAVSGSADITNNGRIGDIVPIGDQAMFSKAMEKIIESDITIEQFNQIRQYAIENFTWERIIPPLVHKLQNG